MNELDGLIALFRDEAGAFLGEIAAALETLRGSTGDREAFVAVRSIVHNLKGASLTVGARRIVDVCQAIETEIDSFGAGNMTPTARQIELWLCAAKDMQRALNDADLIDSASLAASAHARAFRSASVPDTADSHGSSCATSDNALAPAASGSITVCVETQQLEHVALRARIVAQKQAQLALRASALEQYIDEAPYDPELITPDVQRRRDLSAAIRQIHQDLREVNYLVATLNDSIIHLRVSPEPKLQETDKCTQDTRPESHVARRRVLVVDDSLIVRTVEEQILDSAGYDVSVCSDGEEAWGVLDGQRFDLVICDVQMPKLDGFGLTSRIRASPALQHIPVLLVTGRSSSDDLMRGAQVGADGYIAKEDLEQEDLLAAVQRLLQ